MTTATTTTATAPSPTGPCPTGGALVGHEPAGWDHWTFLRTTIELVQRDRATAMDELRAATARRGVPCAGHRPHETLLAFYVWAVERLLDGGLDARRIPWHPLVGPTAPLAWYEHRTLRGAAARHGFVASDRALPGEPAPKRH